MYVYHSHQLCTVTGGYSRTQRRGVMLTDEIGLAGEMSSYFKHRPSVVSLYREQSSVPKLETPSVLQVSTIKHSL